MSDRLSPAMTALLRTAAEHPDGRAYNRGQRGFMATHAALIRRGYLVEVDASAGVITDAGRAAIDRPLTEAERAERAAVETAAEVARVERERVDQLARRYGWRPAAGDRVTLPDGTEAEVIGRVGQAYHCRQCGRSHPFPDVVTARRSVMGYQACELAPTRDTARRWLLGRADKLAAEVAAVPGYPANERWEGEAAELRAAAAELDTVDDNTETVATKGNQGMDDELTERYLIDRAEHDAHADGLAEQIEAEYAEEQADNDRAYQRGRADWTAGTIDQDAIAEPVTGPHYRRGLADARTELVDAELTEYAAGLGSGQAEAEDEDGGGVGYLDAEHLRRLAARCERGAETLAYEGEHAAEVLADRGYPDHDPAEWAAHKRLAVAAARAYAAELRAEADRVGPAGRVTRERIDQAEKVAVAAECGGILIDGRRLARAGAERAWSSDERRAILAHHQAERDAVNGSGMFAHVAETIGGVEQVPFWRLVGRDTRD